ncbi:hypothetical protein HKX48_007268 [Thoreauomyces humboldtii]|nr:hypothetical protein HKX48_007268 [Thoreauomyces humboldtii]
MPETLLVTQVGLDGVVLLRFFKMGAQLFTVLSFFGLSVVGPVNYYANPPNYGNSTGILYEDILIPALTVQNVPRQSRSLWVHLFFTWFFSFIAYSYLIAYYRGLVELKTKHVEHVLRCTHMSKIEIRSIIVFGIPRELRHEVDLASYFEGLGIGKVENVVICRKWSHLRNAVQKRAQFLVQLEDVYAQVMRNLRNNPRRLALPLSRDDISHDGADLPQSLRFASRSETGLNGNPRTASFDATEPGQNEEDDHNDLEGASQPLLSARRRFSTSSDPGDGSLFELMSRLDAVDPRNRPKHRTGFLGLRGPLVDSADFYADKFQEWDRKVMQLRKSPETSAATSAGFVTFESPESAILASQVLLHRRPFACMARLAPEPRDVFWVNLSSKVADSYVKMFRSIAVTAILFLLVFSSTVVVAGITTLIDPTTFSALQRLLSHLGPAWAQFIQGVIPAVVTAAWTSSLPAVLILLAQAQGLEAQSWIDASVLSKYFFYQIWNVLFVQTVASRLWSSRYDIIRHGPGDIIDMLGDLVPKAAPTQINYVMLLATALYPAQLLLAGPLFITWIFRLLSWRRSTPRQVSDAYYPSVLTSINYGIAYPVPILVFCIGLTYAPVAPLILPFCALFFGIAWFVYKYLLLYVNIPRYETGGKHAPMAVRRCLAGIFIMQLTMMGVLALKAGSVINGRPDDGDDDSFMHGLRRTEDKGALRWSGYVQMVVGVGPLLIITSLIYWWFRHGFEKLINHIPLDVVGSVAKELATHRPEESEARDGVAVGEIQIGKELAPVTTPRRTVSKRTSIRATRGRSRKPSSAGADGRQSIGRPSLLEADNEAELGSVSRRPSLRKDSNQGSLPEESWDASFSSSITPSSAGAASSPSPVRFDLRSGDDRLPHEDPHTRSASPEDLSNQQQAIPTSPRPSIEDPDVEDHQDSDSEETDDPPPAIHLEPPMTRVLGILDAPFVSASAIVPAGDQEEFQSAGVATMGGADDDLQLHTYIHPALIGRLPIPWVPGAIQPRRCREAREDMGRAQVGNYVRIVGRQRVGMWELGGGAGADAADGSEEGDDPCGSGAPAAPQGFRRGGRRKSVSVGRKVMSFVDGVTAWAHLSMS